MTPALSQNPATPNTSSPDSGTDVSGVDRGRLEPTRWRKKPVVIDAVLWDGRMPTVEPLLAGSSTPSVEQELGDDALLIPTLEGTMRAEVGDWIIRGIKGELYPCKPDIFADLYELTTRPDPGAVGVKALEWPEFKHTRIRSAGGLTGYTIGRVGDDTWIWARAYSPWSEPLATLDAAKAAAQADFDQRIRSALELAPAVGVSEAEVEALVGRLRGVIGFLNTIGAPLGSTEYSAAQVATDACNFITALSAAAKVRIGATASAVGVAGASPAVVEWDGLPENLPPGIVDDVELWMERADAGDYSTEQLLAHALLNERATTALPPPASPHAAAGVAGTPTHGQGLYSEVVKRLRGAATVSGWAGAPDWQTAIDYLRDRAQQASRCEDVLRDLAASVGAGGYNADKVDPKVFHDKISWGIDHIARVEASRASVQPSERERALEEAARWHEEMARKAAAAVKAAPDLDHERMNFTTREAHLFSAGQLRALATAQPNLLPGGE